jgi:hypothetical protein
MSIAAVTSAKQPTPQEIDAKAKEYCELEEQIADIQADATKKIAPLRERMVPIGETLKTWGSVFGGVHAKKSKLLTGLAYEVMTTAGSSTSLEQSAVVMFLKACKAADKTKIFKRLFETLTVYRTQPAADQVARTELTPTLALSFARCFITTPHAARMDVRPRKKAAESAVASSAS